LTLNTRVGPAVTRFIDQKGLKRAVHELKDIWKTQLAQNVVQMRQHSRARRRNRIEKVGPRDDDTDFFRC